MIEGQDSCLLIHICWKMDCEARTEPQIHTEYPGVLVLRGAMILIFMVLGTRALISFCILSGMLQSMVVLPDSTVWHRGPCRW